MPERLRDAALANEIANLPGVGEYLMADCTFDFSDAIESDRNIFLHDSGGIAIFAWSAPRVYEVHLFFRPECRGRNAIDACFRMIDWLVPEYADAIWAQPPVGQKSPVWMALRTGFKKGAVSAHPVLGPVQYMTRGFP